MNPTPRAFWTMSMVVLFVFGISGCGQKHLSVSTSSGKANEQEELEASLQDTSSEQTGIQDSSLTETGLGNESASQGMDSPKSTDEEFAMVVEPPPLPTIRGENEDDSLNTGEAEGGLASADSDAGVDEGATNPSAHQTSLEPESDSVPSGHWRPGPPLAPIGSTDNDQTEQLNGGSTEEEFGALVQSTEEQGDLMDSSHVERIPENIVVAKVEPSGAVEEQLARIREDEMATVAAGVQDVFFEFDSWKITQEGKDVLEKNANLLQDDAAMNLLIEGHCDQRGTQAYNIVLGKKRAMAIRDYLVALGVESTRLSVVTYGKEKPDCTDQTEMCYQKNRRGHLVLQ